MEAAGVTEATLEGTDSGDASAAGKCVASSGNSILGRRPNESRERRKSRTLGSGAAAIRVAGAASGSWAGGSDPAAGLSSGTAEIFMRREPRRENLALSKSSRWVPREGGRGWRVPVVTVGWLSPFWRSRSRFPPSAPVETPTWSWPALPPGIQRTASGSAAAQSGCTARPRSRRRTPGWCAVLLL